MPLLATLLCAGAPTYVEMRDAQWTIPADPTHVHVGAHERESPFHLRPGPGRAVVRESRVERSALPFRDLLVSWNVDAPARTAFVVELRVSESGDAAWSPWMHVGDWGAPAFAPPLDRRIASCDGGRVDVDHFRGERAFRAAQLRLTAYATAGEPTLEIRRAKLCFADRERAVAPIEPLAARPLGTVLDVALRSQKAEASEIASRICSPTSVAMVLAFRGVDATTLAVAERAYDPVHAIYGNWPRNVQAAYSFGVRGYLTRYADWNAVERAIADGTPIVVSIAARDGQLAGAPYASTEGHLLVLVGFDARGDCVVNDPAAPDAASARRTYRREDMDVVWMRRGGTAYVLDEARR